MKRYPAEVEEEALKDLAFWLLSFTYREIDDTDGTAEFEVVKFIHANFDAWEENKLNVSALQIPDEFASNAIIAAVLTALTVTDSGSLVPMLHRRMKKFVDDGEFVPKGARIKKNFLHKEESEYIGMFDTTQRPGKRWYEA